MAVEADGDPPSASSRRLEPHQRHLLGEFFDSRITGCEHRDPELAVDTVVPLGIGPQHRRIEIPAANHDRVVIVEPEVRDAGPSMRTHWRWRRHITSEWCRS